MARHRGFALVDALLATMILVIGVLSLAQLFALGTRANATAGRVTRASILAAQKIEELRSAPWGAAHSGEDVIDEFTRRWSVGPLPGDPGGTAIIDVSVTPGAVRLVTLRAKVDP
jgi:Tfp pilus assembly protein PilV